MCADTLQHPPGDGASLSDDARNNNNISSALGTELFTVNSSIVFPNVIFKRRGGGRRSEEEDREEKGMNRRGKRKLDKGEHIGIYMK